MKKKPKAPAKITFRHLVDDTGATIFIDGLQLVSEANQREHFMAKNRRKRSQELVVREAVRRAQPLHFKTGRILIRLTRFGPGRLDRDNLAGAFKYVIDELCRGIGRDDGEEDVMIAFDQTVGKSYAAQIAIDRP